MTTIYEIAHIHGRDGIRTRKDGEIAFAELTLADGSDIRIQTQASNPARPVFTVRQYRDAPAELIAQNDAAEDFVAAQIADFKARTEAVAAAQTAAHEGAETAFGAITIGTPKQIAYAEIKRAQSAPAVQKFLAALRSDRFRPTAEDAARCDELIAAIEALLPHAKFWLDVAGRIDSAGGDYARATDKSRTAIGMLLVEV